ncbi:hypothetical protein ACWGRL_05065 [[Kitasatospora] papulosa]|jgi:hypothetical protein
MSAYATICCDSEETDVGLCMSEGTTLGLSSTATEVRAYLRTQGWHRTAAGRDICPACWSAGRR